MNSIKFSLISILLLSTALAKTLDELEPMIIDVEESDFKAQGRSLLGYPKLRIALDYTYVTEGTEEFQTYVKTELIPAITSYFNNALKIKSPVLTKINTTAKTICSLPTPQSLIDGVSADMVFVITTKNDTDGSWAAATTLCALSPTKKPLVVKISLNTKTFGIASVDKNPLTHDLYITTVAHEFIHALGMNGVYYKYFVDNSGNFLTNHILKMEVAGENRTVLDLPALTTRLRNYYGCSTLPGVMMEDDGGAHLERRYHFLEAMSNGQTQGSKISEISLGFLEGTGWYIPDYTYAEPYFFGKGQGCDFIFGSCDAEIFTDEFCTGTGRGCNHVGSSGAYCKSDSKSESCRAYMSQIDFNCENPSGIYYTTLPSKQVFGRGLGSKCFTGNLTTKSATIDQTSYCFTYSCQGEGLNTKLIVNFGTLPVTCAAKGPATVTGYKGFIDCPDPIQFCTTVGKPACPRNCLGRGTCVSGKCQCKTGFQGTDCGFTA